MISKAETPEQYIAELPEDRKEIIQKLRKTLKGNLPEGYEEEISYGMIGYIVPYSIYPAGYAVKPKVPLPFIMLASQKNYIALHHMAIYADPNLLEWFQTEYPKHCKTKLDMGKGCIRFKNPEDIPYELIAELAKKVNVNEWINLYENIIRKKK
ncbi:conserved hypothetical protein [uncultured Paludibacter sp.]|nr:conserved hypothetical protein [uncultured Paludibacter sp.]